MTYQHAGTDYAVVVTRLGRGIELRIRELLISVRADDVAEGWRLIQERKHEMIDCARAAGLIDELPRPLPPPPA